ncbi:multi-sensor signal transduction histidine kinase [Paludibacterium purpuratum]|uniref:Oxygen sensor histidine kinase NreB n=2 Tax=Paludibacterium purpuratum TaxID=1144873 RepID=A0A4R7B942_9NEIS|nr:multi-sensor signal transduction histidine kinase [Paludibacterium purpuratum]
MNLLASQNGLHLSWRVYPNQNALDAAVERDEVDVAPGMQQTPATLRHWLFSLPYLRVPHKLVGFRAESADVVELDRLALNERLAIDQSSDAWQFVERNYPELTRLPARSDRQAVQAVEQQRAQYAIVDEAQLALLFKEPAFSNLAVVGDIGDTRLLRLAVRKDWPELPALLDQALSQLPPERLEKIRATWLRPNYPRLLDTIVFWQRLTLALTIAALLALGLWRRQRRARRHAEARLLSAWQELETRNATEAELRLSQFSIDNSTVGILWVSWDSRIRYANRTAERMLGYAQGALLARRLAELEPLLDSHTWLDAWNRLRTNHEIQSFETQCRRLDGQPLAVSVTLSFLQFGRAEYLVVYLNDITERYMARAALAESEARYKSMAANVPGMVFRLETPQAGEPPRLAFVGAASQHLLGYPAQTVQGWSQGWRQAVDEADLPGYLAAWHQAVDEARDWRWQGRLRHRDGHSNWVDLRASVRRFDDGRRVWDGIVWDISQNKHHELQLAESRSQLRSLAAHLESVREEEKARIAREVHDELGQILTVLRLETSMCELGFAHLDTKLAERLGNMKKLIESTFQIVRDVASALRPPVLDAGLGSAIEWQARRFESRTGIACLVSVPDTPLHLDDTQAIGLFRILQEALTNVLRHAEAATVSIGLSAEARRVSLSIADDGKGFQPERQPAGRSFGLVGMRERVWLLGGELQIDSQPGQGTTLLVRLPVDCREEIQ